MLNENGKYLKLKEFEDKRRIPLFAFTPNGILVLASGTVSKYQHIKIEK
jgi:hypothetical protein